MILDMFNIFSSFFGLIGTAMIFKFGVPSRIDTGGVISLTLEQTDEKEIKEISKYKFFGNIGLGLIFVSFLFQLSIGIGFDWKIKYLKTLPKSTVFGHIMIHQHSKTQEFSACQKRR